MLARLRSWLGRWPAARPAPARFRPGFTTLEGRDVPAALPFHETLTLTGVTPDGVAQYAGQATHLGRVTADLNLATNEFVKYAADGSTLVGFGVYDPGTTSTGTLTTTGGTGRLAGTTGTSRFVIAADAATGAVTVAVSGTLSLGGPAGAAAGTQAVPFRITGSGPALDGLPLTPGQSGAHEITSGTATRLGRHTGTGTFTLRSLAIDQTTGAVSGTFQGAFEFVAANGDTLAFTYGAGGTGTFTGQLSANGTVEGVVFDAIFAYDPTNSTGRFASLSGGSFRMIAEADSVPLAGGAMGYTGPFSYSWSGEGTLEFGKKKK